MLRDSGDLFHPLVVTTSSNTYTCTVTIVYRDGIIGVAMLNFDDSTEQQILGDFKIMAC